MTDFDEVYISSDSFKNINVAFGSFSGSETPETIRCTTAKTTSDITSIY